MEDATRDLAAALDAKDKDTADAATARVEQLRAEMSDALVTVRFEAMPRARWLELLTEHAPRDGHPVDERVGFNTATLYEGAIRESWASPEIDAEDMTALLDALNARQFDDLADAAFSVNARSVSIPFGWRGSSPTPD
jgi:hypothetical protein